MCVLCCVCVYCVVCAVSCVLCRVCVFAEIGAGRGRMLRYYTLGQDEWYLFYTISSLTSFVTRIDSFLSVFCCVCIAYDTHGVPNARCSHDSTATRR